MAFSTVLMVLEMVGHIVRNGEQGGMEPGEHATL